MTSRRCYIIPDHILRNIAERGTPDQRESARRTLATSVAFRALRAIAPPTQAVEPNEGEVRTVYDAQHATRLPGVIVRREDSPAAADETANEAYDGAGLTYAMYREVFGRNSVDGRGLELRSTVHYDRRYNNAFWTGPPDNQMVYGDGDGDFFNRFTIAVEIDGHEISHAVTQFTAGLAYHDQPGALNESNSDIFGSLVKQYWLNQTAEQSDWLIGSGLFTARVHGRALRDMRHGQAYSDPVLGDDPQPLGMDAAHDPTGHGGYVKTSQDNGGVHINSGIPNKAFVNMALAFGGHAWERAGQIWYRALTTKFQAETTFQGAADLTVQAARELYGAAEVRIVVDACNAVGITTNDGDAPPPPPPGHSPCGQDLQAFVQDVMRLPSAKRLMARARLLGLR